MKSRSYQLRARLTREGWYYLAVLSFIVGGAALCHVNLLVILGGMMLAPLLINWRLALASLRSISVRRLPMRPVHAGQPLVVEFEITNPRWWLAAWMVTVEDQWFRVTAAGAKKVANDWFSFDSWVQWLMGHEVEAVATAFAPCVEPGATVRTSYELLFSRRGRYAIHSFRLRSCFPLGLIEAVATITDSHEVLVLPRIGRLSAEWTHRIAAALSGEGERQLRHRAGDGEFFAVRPWQSGDSMRWMHWRTTARAGRPMVRQFERESSPTVALILDPYLPATPTAGDRARCEAAISFVATALTDLAQRDVARLALIVANEEKLSCIGSRSPVFLEEVFAQLSLLPGHATDHRDGIEEQLAQEAPEAACILLVSSRPSSDASQTTTGGEKRILAEEHTISVASPEFATLYSLE
jgi:uncharacterized protein (DUF58 family)